MNSKQIVVIQDESGIDTFVVCKPHKFFTVLMFLFLFLHYGNAQTTIVKDANGNYKATGQPRAKTPPTATANTFTDSKGVIYPVYISKTGKHFVIRLSKKSGKHYNQYLD